MNSYRVPKETSEFKNANHIDRKKKVLSKKLNRQSDDIKSFEYGLDSKDELRNYKQFLR
jgi:hypothetical protein